MVAARNIFSTGSTHTLTNTPYFQAKRTSLKKSKADTTYSNETLNKPPLHIQEAGKMLI